MVQVPSNLIPTRITQLPESPTASAEGYLIFVYEGRTYKIRAGDIVSGTIPDGSITEAKLAANAVTAPKIADSSVTGTKLGAGAVSSTKIADGAVLESKLATGVVTETKLSTGAVTETKLAAGAVTNSKIGTAAVSEAKLQDSAVTEGKIAAGAVTPSKLSASYARSGDNTDITSLSGLSRVDFSTTGGVPVHAEGRLFYDTASHSLAYYNDNAGVTVNLGREQLVRVLNNTGSTLLNGKAVYINGAVGGWPTVVLAQANSAVASQSTLGVVTADIPTGQYGYVCTSGVVNDVNTASYSAGARLYLSATSAGDFTATPPLQPNYVVEVATVADSNVSTGKLFVHVDKSAWFPNAEIRDIRASITLPTAPAVFVAQTLASGSGFSYDTVTGVLTISNSGSYAISIQFNAQPSASNKNIYFYAEDSADGVTWNITRYSGRQLLLPNATETQVSVNASRYYAAGTRLRFYVWGDATVTLNTTDLAGTTPGAVTKPAYRFLIA